MLFKAVTFFTIISIASATPRAYNDFEISGGTAGNALAEAEASFPLASGSVLSGTALQDVNTEAHCAVLAEAAYISAVSAAGSTTAAGKALSNGLIKNKVLKLFSTLQAENGFIAVQGNSSANAAQVSDLSTKLATNVALDEAVAGEASTAVSFTCPTS